MGISMNGRITPQTADDYMAEDTQPLPFDPPALAGTPGDPDGVLAGLRANGFFTADPATFSALDGLTTQLEELRIRAENAESDAANYAALFEEAAARVEVVGAALTALRQSLRTARTPVAITSDHGDPMVAFDDGAVAVWEFDMALGAKTWTVTAPAPGTRGALRAVPGTRAALAHIKEA
jgi:hypothetical protein